MPCTTVLVGKKASNDGSTMIARTDDGAIDVKKIVVFDQKKQGKKYKSVIGHLEIELPENPLSYTLSPSVDKKDGIWAATGINEVNVGMTATETITTNSRVLGADPYVEYKKAKNKKEKDTPGGIGEEDLVVLVLPYIHSAREGVIRTAELLKKYGTYESNGIAFNDKDEVWWLETIGGHHFMAKKVKDEECVIMPNQFGMDSFDFEDAFGEQKAHLCSEDLLEFIEKNSLDLNNDGKFNPRSVFGSRRDADHVYNTPRAWFMGRYLAPKKYRWDGENADFTPESDDIPWSFVPEKKLAAEDIKYLLSSHYQGTPYDPYSYRDTKTRGNYRSIGINRTGVTSICQIRNNVPSEISGIEWVFFGPTSFNTMLPVYTAVKKMPKYLSEVTLDVSTENFYWSSRLLAALTDPHFATGIQHIERYELKTVSRAREILNKYDRQMTESGDFSLTEKANEELAAMVKEETTKTLNKVILNATQHMKDAYSRADK